LVNKISDARWDELAANVADGATVASLLAVAATCVIARLDAEVMLASVLRCSRAQLSAHTDQTVDDLTTALYMACLQRRSEGEPVAYITGTKEFWSLPLVVTPDVLIPRPETELLVELCLAQLGADAKRVADLGTGSGAIALAVAKERPQWQVLACDASAAALQVAQINAQRLGLRNIEFRQGNWCAALLGERLDAIVSNPPYVDPADPALAELEFEPRAALVAAEHGYADLFTIARTASTCLRSGGLLLLEHGATQAAGLGGELSTLGYMQIVAHRDLSGHERVTIAQWP
jgi:release factor glutamine methyltransferase